MEEIELDDVQVVEVTGRAYKDKHSRRGSGGCSCNPSLRVTTILIFLIIGAIYVVGVIIGNVLMRESLTNLDKISCNSSINRLAMLMFDDMDKLKQLAAHYARSDQAVGVASSDFNMSQIEAFQNAFLNGSVCYVYSPECIAIGFASQDCQYSCYSTGSEVCYWAFLDTQYKTRWSIYYPGVDGAMAGTTPVEPQPLISPQFYELVIGGSKDKTAGWLKYHVPYKNVREPFYMSIEPVISPTDTAKPPKVWGYQVAMRALKPRLSLFSDNVPTCITLMNTDADKKFFDEDDLNNFDQVKEGTFTDKKVYGGVPYFAQRARGDVNKSKLRICPAVPLFNETDELMVGYMKLCGVDPKAYPEHKSCFSMRLDRPMSMVDEGTKPVIALSFEIIGMMIVVCVIFVIFLDLVVLRRIVNLSNVIRSQTHGHAKAMQETEESSTQVSSAKDDKEKPEEPSKGSHSGKMGKSSRAPSENSRTTTSSDGGAPGGLNARDEIGNLRRVMEQNALGLRKRLETVNDQIKIEQQKTAHHKQAMQLLNLWCGRKDYFPGLRPNAMQLRYEPTRSLDDLLDNPLAIEYLKSHCDSDRSLENLWFLLDVSWLKELEAAEDKEEDPAKRKQIHDVASASAMTILSRYISVNAPQQINISAASFKTLRDKGDVYERGMFEAAVGEVKLMLNTDILPRFQKSTAYSAMSETLFIDSAGGGDESEFSDETVSTAGSILTDEGEEGEAGVSRVFAHAFKNLHNTFEVGHDTDNSSTYSADSSHATNTLTSGTAGTAGPSVQILGGAGTQGASSDKDSSESEKKPAKEEPKKEEEEPKKEEEPKEAKGASADSSDSSSSETGSMSISSDSASSSE